MPTFQVQQEVSLEEARHALADTLGPAYRVEFAGGAALKVKRNAAMWSTVRESSSGGVTTFRVSSGGLIVIRAVNAITVTPKVRHALESAFPGSPPLRTTR